MPANMRYWLEGLCADMQLLIDAGYQPQAVDNRRAASEYTFTGTNQKIWSNYTDAATALNFKFIGITSKPAYEQVYMLSADFKGIVIHNGKKVVKR